MCDPDRAGVSAAMPDDVTLNRLAQRFYEASGISIRMTDKPLIVKGLRAVFEALGDEDDDAIPMRTQP